MISCIVIFGLLDRISLSIFCVMVQSMPKSSGWILVLLTFFVSQPATGTPVTPSVMVPTGSRVDESRHRPSDPALRISYPWKLYVTYTIFWVGEEPSARNPTPNTKSSWDQQWVANFGGCDDPDPTNRVANHTTGEFRPKNFVPKLNPFYVALPYNDVLGFGKHKPEAARVIPWFSRARAEPGKSVCKGRWVQIYNGSRSCYAQWEDCGPWGTDDWEFVFGSKSPKTTENGAAGIDLSPSIRDYLGLTSGKKVHWRFVEASQVPEGPWKKYRLETPGANDPSLLAQQRYLESLRRIRDAQFQKKSLNELSN